MQMESATRTKSLHNTIISIDYENTYSSTDDLTCWAEAAITRTDWRRAGRTATAAGRAWIAATDCILMKEFLLKLTKESEQDSLCLQLKIEL